MREIATIIGPRKNPNGPKNSIPPKILSNINNGCICVVEPITFGVTILSMDIWITAYQIIKIIAGTKYLNNNK